MTPEAMSPPTLPSGAVDAYQADGYLHLDAWVEPDWMRRLQAAADRFVELSRTAEPSDRRFDTESDHTAQAPRLRRLVSPVELDETFREFAFEGPAASLAMSLLGGPVRYHHSKLNFKWSHGGAAVKWHQDIQFWPHTDFTPLTIGVYLDDVDDDMGPMGVLPGSHLGALYDLYDTDGTWAGAMSDVDVASIALDDVVWLTGGAGSVTVHNCCMVHGSMPNRSDRPRPLLLQTYSAIDSYPVLGIGANGVDGRLSGAIVGGAANQELIVEGRSLRGAPDWRRTGAPTIFGSQHDTET